MSVRKEKTALPKSKAGKQHITGIIELTRKAVGYLPWPLNEARGKPNEPEKEDIEIQTANLSGALNGDEVEVEVIGFAPSRPSVGGRGVKVPSRFQGKVVKVVSRAKEDFVCTIKSDVAVPDDIKFYKPITIAKGAYGEGEKVLMHLESFDGSIAKGTVLEHLGRAGEHRVEMNAIVLEHGFRTSFSP